MEHFEPQEVDPAGALQILVSSIDYNEYVGRIGIGRIERGTARVNQDVAVINYNAEGRMKSGKLVSLYQIEGLERSPVDSAAAGDIVCFSGLDGLSIGDTVCDPAVPEPVPFVKISEPTVEMTFSVNDSPFAGKEGKFVTTRHLRDRLFREMLKDVSSAWRKPIPRIPSASAGEGKCISPFSSRPCAAAGMNFRWARPGCCIRRSTG